MAILSTAKVNNTEKLFFFNVLPAAKPSMKKGVPKIPCRPEANRSDQT